MSKVTKIKDKIKNGYLKEAFHEILWLYAVAKEYKGKIISYSMISVCSMLITMFFNTQLKSVVDYVTLNQWGQVIKIVGIYVGIGSINMVITMYSQRLSAVTEVRVKNDLSLKVFDKVMAADFEELMKYHSGDLLTRIQEDTDNIAGSTVGWIPNLIIQGVQAGLALLLILYYDASLVVVVALVFPIIVVGSRLFVGKSYESNKKQRVVASQMMEVYNDSFRNMQTIKAFGLHSWICKKVDKEQKNKMAVDLEVNKYSILSWAVMYLSGQIAGIICLSWAMYHVYRGFITLGTVATIFALAMTISSSFHTFLQMFPQAMKTITSASRIEGMLCLKNESLQDLDEMNQLCERGLLKGVGLAVSKVSFHYSNGKQIFNEVSFEAKLGETVALVGPSGEGKTTMLRILLGLLKCQNGSVCYQIDGEQIPVSPSTRRLIAYVPQGNTMMYGTIADNLRMVKNEATDKEIIDALKRACAYEFVEKLPDGIHHLIGEGGISFSEGQNQRLAIARALICDAPILLLDEATSALDVETERKILRNLMGNVGVRTCIITTHRPSVLSMCDKIFRISDQHIEQLNEEQIQIIMNDF